MAEINTIIFDLGGVIINVDASFTMAAFSKLGIPNPHEIFTIEKQGRLCDKLEVGELSPEDFIRELSDLTPNDVSYEEIITAWNAMLLDIPAHRIDLLKQLSKKYKLYLLSNTNPMHTQYANNLMLKTYGVTFEDLFLKTYYSFEVGLRKADPKVFQHILDENSLIPKETLLVDDLENNILSAHNLGMQTCHVKRNKFDGSELLTKGLSFSEGP